MDHHDYLAWLPALAGLAHTLELGAYLSPACRREADADPFLGHGTILELPVRLSYVWRIDKVKV